MLNLLLFCMLAFFCWPVALAVLFLYPIIWLVLLPFRLVGFALHGAFALVAAIFLLPAKALRAI